MGEARCVGAPAIDESHDAVEANVSSGVRQLAKDNMTFWRRNDRLLQQCEKQPRSKFFLGIWGQRWNWIARANQEPRKKVLEEDFILAIQGYIKPLGRWMLVMLAIRFGPSRADTM